MFQANPRDERVHYGGGVVTASRINRANHLGRRGVDQQDFTPLPAALSGVVISAGYPPTPAQLRHGEKA